MSKRMLVGSFNFNSVANHPNLKLIETTLPPNLELLHPFPIFRGVRNIHNDSRQVVTVDVSFMELVADNIQVLETDTGELIEDFENRITQKLFGYFPAIIPLERDQYLESPPSAGHM